MKSQQYILVILYFLIGLDLEAQELRFQRLGVDEGLSSIGNWASDCLIKDKFGFVWIGTNNGLNRWDGYEVENFHHDPFDSTSIGSNFITSIAEDKDYLYIGTGDAGLLRYDYKKNVFENVKGIAFNDKIPQINNIHTDIHSNVWIITAFAGAWQYSSQLDTIVEIPILFEPTSDTYEENFLNATLRANGELVLIGYEYVYIYNPINQKTKSYLKPDRDLGIVEEDQNGNLWLSSKFGYKTWILDPKSGDFKLFPPSKNISNSIIKKDPDGNIWYTGYPEIGKLFKYSPITKSTTEFNHFGVPTTMVFDSLGSMWCMTYSDGAGYTMIDQPYFEKLTDTYVCKVLSVSQDAILYTSGASILRLDLNTKEIEDIITSDNGFNINSSYLDSNNDIYYTVRNKYGVYKYNLDSKKTTHFNKNLKVNYNFLEDNSGNLWTTHNLGFINKSTGDLTFVNDLVDEKALKLPSTNSFDTEFLSETEIAMATLTDGFYIFDSKDSTITQYDGKNASMGQLSNSHIINIHKSRDSQIVYVATDAGLNIWDLPNDTFSYIDKKNGLEGKILCMYEDKNRNLWLQSTRGLYHIKNQKVVALYGEKYDLHSNENIGDQSMQEDVDGNIYVSTSRALFRFDPEILQQIPNPKDVIIKNLYLKREKILPKASRILDEAIQYKQDLTLDYSERDIGFSYVSPFERDSELKYHYRLIGYDTTWVNNKDSRIVHFTNLNNGKYTFEVKAKSAEGKWTPNVTSLSFTINPPWYKTWWSYFLFTFFIFSVLYALFKYRINQITKYQKLRTKISSDLHDDVGTLLSSLAMQSDVLGLDAPPEKVSKFEKFSELSREAMDRMRDTVWAIDSRKDNMMSLVDRMADYISDMYEDHKIRVNFDHDKSNLSKSLAPDIRQNVYLIFKEALNNAMKYSNGDRVDIVLNQSSSQFLLSIKDNGTASETKTSGLGISNMKMRAKRIKGSLTITNNDGFEVSLIVKK